MRFDFLIKVKPFLVQAIRISDMEPAKNRIEYSEYKRNYKMVKNVETTKPASFNWLRHSASLWKKDLIFEIFHDLLVRSGTSPPNSKSIKYKMIQQLKTILMI